MWGINLSVPLSIVALVSRYLTNQLMERMPIYNRLIFNKYPHAGPLYYGVLVRLSTGYPPVVGRLHTRYSPVRRSPPSVLLLHVLPLDLHVLGLSLAFILSQDQTLRCKFVFCIPLKLPSIEWLSTRSQIYQIYTKTKSSSFSILLLINSRIHDLFFLYL